ETRSYNLTKVEKDEVTTDSFVTTTYAPEDLFQINQVNLTKETRSHNLAKDEKDEVTTNSFVTTVAQKYIKKVLEDIQTKH
ncbi:23946_t:CDS:2, partial [Gigaspora rosea]